MTRKELAARLASLYEHRGLREYARWKVRTDPVYDAVLHELPDEPLVDVGCGIGLLPFYLREHGFTAPIIGIDFDERKIDAARRAAQRYRDIEFIVGDARAPLPEGHNVTVLDVLQYVDDDGQQQLLRNAARADTVVLRQGIRDGSLRSSVTVAAERLLGALRWLQMEKLNFPSAATIENALPGVVARPLWGRTPYNNYLFVYRRSSSDGITNE